jgi:hypothetical protein
LAVRMFRNRNGVVFAFQGKVTRKEMEEAKLALLAQSTELARLMFVMVDHTEAVLDDLSTADLLDLAKLDQKLARHTPAGMLVAVAVARDLEYGLARMWQAFIDGSGWEIAVFRSRMEAEHWIRERVHEKFNAEVGEFPDATECRL